VSRDPTGNRRRSSRRPTGTDGPKISFSPSRDDEHEIKYFRRHPDDDPAETAPGQAFLHGCNTGVRAKFRATLVAVAAAPPHRFAGGGYWEAMHGEMTGWFEVRRPGRDRSQHRLFCLIDLDAIGARKPWLVVITGLSKPWRTAFSDADYQAVRDLGSEYRRRNPRSVA
jgi:hypothetical protein